MAKRRGHKALYEVLGNSKLKSSYRKTLEDIREPEQKPPETPQPEPQQEVTTDWPKKPKMLQFNESRIDLTLPYPIVIAALMVFILLLLVCFRLGQITYRNRNAPSQTSDAQQAAVGRLIQPVEQQEVTTKVLEPPILAGSTAKTGNNRIVIQQYHLKTHLEPVRAYFDKNGIETEILNINNTYFLVTKNKYENPSREGTDGYNTKKRIIELGARYAAPEGYENFGKQPFHDAYGRRFDE
ncbi:MAG: hypothetical protein ACYSUK_11565 [Planctomycetota bacterium]|jgi:hypothetical protein